MKQIELTPGLTLDKVLQLAQNEDIVVTQYGRAVALISEFDDEDLYWYARERDPEFLASIARARQQVQEGKFVRLEDLKRQLGLPEDRAE